MIVNVVVLILGMSLKVFSKKWHNKIQETLVELVVDLITWGAYQGRQRASWMSYKTLLITIVGIVRGGMPQQDKMMGSTRIEVTTQVQVDYLIVELVV